MPAEYADVRGRAQGPHRELHWYFAGDDVIALLEQYSWLEGGLLVDEATSSI